MRLRATPVLVSPLLLTTVPAHAAGPSLPPNAHVQLVADDDEGRSSFTQHAQDDMQEWQHKVYDFGQHAKATGQQGARSARDDLNTAFSKAKLAADRLHTVGADGWQGAKSGYQHARHDLTETWDRIKP
jgi:hypothetical protein